MDTQLLDQILRDNFTPTSCLRRLHLLKDLMAKKLFQKDQVLKKSELLLLGKEDADWINTIDKSLLDELNGKNYDQIFQSVEEKIKQIQPLTIFVPLAFSNDQVIEIGLYLRRTYGSNFLMETKIDPSLIAGAALSWKGIYKDYSLKKRMEDQKPLVLNALKQYIKH